MVDSLILPRQRALTSMSPHAGNPNVIIPKRAFSRTVMVPAVFVNKTGFSSPALFGFGAMTPDSALGRDIVQVTHDSGFAQTEILFAQTFAGELLEDFWHSVTFRSADSNWDRFTLLRSTNTQFDDTDPGWAIWNFLTRNVPFVAAETYELTWRR